ncbi:HTH-type transcriptional regulatory protein GabR [Gimesia panareensis]|uniref:HTH-type transcriptional regulatory protein GabR n=1 Tax=Gimesia panareensis TaxID=2527978 RepID=A0A517QEM5_9PLAN|nr:PLP-dependent aminotransferase family protein [Gimesia panareensis]QDT29987.1 HTH-type transcriptional regulatory protein GabR [Gimesia panareensis]
MGRRAKQHFEFEAISIDKSAGESQYRQLENQIREAITGGLLPAGARVPSSRRLAQMLEISRNTVLTAYEQLLAEGYLESETGSGTRVAQFLPEAFEYTEQPEAPQATGDFEELLSTSGKVLARYAGWMPDFAPLPQPFRPHLPAVKEFPSASWNRLSNEQARWSMRHLDQCDAQGYEPLRQAVAEYMGVSRGVSCNSAQVIITSGAQQGLNLVTQVLLERQDTIWVEEPGNAPANQLLELLGFRIVPVPVDQAGIDLTRVPDQKISPKLIYVTPGGQWPLAMTMSPDRRQQLLTEAERRQSWIIEDDYNGEFRYTGRPHPTLSSLDQRGQTIYMGSFSKLLFPAIRLGFLIVPEQIAGAFRYARWLNDRFSSPLTQMVLHRFIESGQFLKHIRQMRSLYQERQACLYETLLRELGEVIDVDLPESGMHLVVQGKTPQLDQELMAAADRAGMEYHAVRMYAQEPEQVPGMILGFAAFDQKQIRKAVRNWAQEFNQR